MTKEFDAEAFVDSLLEQYTLEEIEVLIEEALEEQITTKGPLSQWLSKVRANRNPPERIEPTLNIPKKKSDYDPTKPSFYDELKRRYPDKYGTREGILARANKEPQGETSSPAHDTMTQHKTKTAPRFKPVDPAAEAKRRREKAMQTKSLRKTFGVAPGRRKPIGEDVEQIDEVSKKLAKRYAKKAVDSHGHANFAARNSTGKEKEKYSRIEKNRKVGISRAVKKMDEDVEQIDENKHHAHAALMIGDGHTDSISKKKDGSYVFRKGYFYSHGNTSEKYAQHVSDALTKAGVKHEVVHHEDNWKPFKGGAPISRQSHFAAHVKIHDWNNVKSHPNFKDYVEDSKHNLDESFEQIDEISKKTLNSYNRKARKQGDAAWDKWDELKMVRYRKGELPNGIGNHPDNEEEAKHKSVWNKRYTGREHAKDRLKGNFKTKSGYKKYTAESFEQIDERAAPKKSIAHTALSKIFSTLKGKKKPTAKKRKSPTKKPSLVVNKNAKFKKGSGSGVNIAKKGAKKPSLAAQTNSLRKTFGVAPGKRYKNKPLNPKSKRTTTLVKEEFINELSKKTLKSYLNKAVAHDGVFGTHKTTHAEIKKNNQRLLGKSKAHNRLNGFMYDKTKRPNHDGTPNGRYHAEEIEQIDEISKKTLKSYVDKAKNFKKIAKKAVSGGIKQANAANKRGDSSQDYHYWIAMNAQKKIAQRDKGIKQANKKLKEEIEQIDEISNKTLKSYISKANNDLKDLTNANAGMSKRYRNASPEYKKHLEKQVEKNMKKSNNRKSGIVNATLKITENVSIEEAIKMKLRPGITARAFAKQKKEVLAKQTAAQKSVTLPKPDFSKIKRPDPDENNRGARMLKGNYPWGSVTAELAKSALARLRNIPKPQDRLNAMNAIWGSQEHFHTLVKHGHNHLGHGADNAPVKPRITLPKITGVTD